MRGALAGLAGAVAVAAGELLHPPSAPCPRGPATPRPRRRKLTQGRVGLAEALRDQDQVLDIVNDVRGSGSGEEDAASGVEGAAPSAAGERSVPSADRSAPNLSRAVPVEASAEPGPTVATFNSGRVGLEDSFMAHICWEFRWKRQKTPKKLKLCTL
eukprot:1964396-Rhodomonas_salina.1